MFNFCWGRGNKRFIWFTSLCSQKISKGRQDRNPKQRRRKWSRDHGGVLLPGLLNLSFSTTKVQCPKDGHSHSELGPPTSIMDQENIPQTCQYDRGIFSIGVSSSYISLCCVKWTENGSFVNLKCRDISTKPSSFLSCLCPRSHANNMAFYTTL